MRILTRKVKTAWRLLRKEGVAQFSLLVYNMASIRLGIYLRRRNERVVLDGCTFELRGIPNTRMKLELLTGKYEEPERRAVLKYLRRELPVVELGGCIGVVACMTNKLLRDPRKHVVLEPNPLVIPHLRSNREVNQSSFTIVNQALAYNCETVAFRPSLDFWGNSLDQNSSAEAPVTVPATQLSRIIREARFEKYALICDIEGREYDLVLQEAEAIRKAEIVILEVHPHVLGEKKAEAVLSKFGALGFRILDRSALVVVLSKN